VLTRDAWACRDCGHVNNANHADHVVAIAQGGERYDVANGQTLCVRCHGRKTLEENRQKV
jgi:5-methylcytosine-specific restriction protein A